MKFSRLGVVLVALLLAACATLLGPREVTVPLSELQASLAKRFPFNNRYLELFDISVTNPQLTLQPETNRVLTSMDTAVAPPFLDKTLNGKLTLSGRLKIDPARNAVVLAEPRVEQMNLQGLDSRYQKQITRVVGLLAEQLLEDMPIYTFQPEDFRFAGSRYLPTGIKPLANGLVVTFEPAR